MGSHVETSLLVILRGRRCEVVRSVVHNMMVGPVVKKCKAHSGSKSGKENERLRGEGRKEHGESVAVASIYVHNGVLCVRGKM